MKSFVSENKFNSTLSNTISDMVISQLKSREKIPDNLYGINVDAHDSKYGKMCHITYLFNDSISGYDSYAMRPIQLVVRRNIKTLFKDVFRGGFYDSLKSMNDFDKPDLIRPIRESKMRSKKIIVTESQYKRLLNEEQFIFLKGNLKINGIPIKPEQKLNIAQKNALFSVGNEGAYLSSTSKGRIDLKKGEYTFSDIMKKNIINLLPPASNVSSR